MDSNKTKFEELGPLFLWALAFALGFIVSYILVPILSSLLIIPIFSNIGVIEAGIDNFGDITIKEISMTDPITSPTNFVLASNIFNGQMAVTSIVCGMEAYIAKVESFFEPLFRELLEYRQNEVDIITEELIIRKTSYS